MRHQNPPRSKSLDHERRPSNTEIRREDEDESFTAPIPLNDKPTEEAEHRIEKDKISNDNEDHENDDDAVEPGTIILGIKSQIREAEMRMGNGDAKVLTGNDDGRENFVTIDQQNDDDDTRDDDDDTNSKSRSSKMPEGAAGRKLIVSPTNAPITEVDKPMKMPRPPSKAKERNGIPRVEESGRLKLNDLS